MVPFKSTGHHLSGTHTDAVDQPTERRQTQTDRDRGGRGREERRRREGRMGLGVKSIFVLRNNCVFKSYDEQLVSSCDSL